MISNSQIRANARKQLGGGIFQSVWVSTMLAFLIYDLINGALAFTAIGTLLVMGPLTYGFNRILCKNARGSEKVELGNLFCGFSEDFANTLLLNLMTAIFTFLWSLLLIIPGIIKSYSYSMASFIQQDEADKDWNNCLKASMKMMKGHKMKLFLLDLSFIGWYIVGALCCGIGILFVVPYHMQARAAFYEELHGTQNETVEF